MTISLCMLVKNEEAGIARAIESVRRQINEIVIIDDASTDRTVEIAKKYGAKVVPLPWPVSECGFGQAVNFMIDQCTMEWILILDGDELLEPGDLHPLTRYADKTVWALPRRKWDNYALNSRVEIESFPDFQPKFFKRDPKNKFEGQMHIQWRGDRINYGWRGPHIEHLQEEGRNEFKNTQRPELYADLAARQGVAVHGGHQLVPSLSDDIYDLDM